MSPERNHRSDEYGGSLRNRALFLYQVYEAVRGTVGGDFPVFIKLNADDGTDAGFRLDEAIEVSKNLSDMGIDAIEVSGGVPIAGEKGAIRVVRGPDTEGYFFQEAKAIKAVVSCPVISVGGWRSRASIEAALNHVDAVSMSRPFIRQPDLANLWKKGAVAKAACISCNRCMGEGLESKTACAVVLDKVRKAEKNGGGA